MSMILDIDYKCDESHALRFIHLLDKKLRTQSGSPAVCWCGKLYIYAQINNSVEYFSKRLK